MSGQIRNANIDLGKYHLILRTDRHCILIKKDQPNTDYPLFEGDLTEQEIKEGLRYFSHQAEIILDTLAQYSLAK